MQKHSNYQYLTFNLNGDIVQSNNQLFLSSRINKNEAGDLIDFCQSIFPHICDALKGQNLITFKGLQTPSKLLPGTYDFVFSPKTNSQNPNNHLIECWIIDRTVYYQDIQQFWQNYREEALAIAS